jgi:hypothetical protein
MKNPTLYQCGKDHFVMMSCLEQDHSTIGRDMEKGKTEKHFLSFFQTV